jgi:hypothetical protein
MIIAVWVIFGVTALLWTVGSYIAVKLTQWGTQLLTTASFEQLNNNVAQWPLPESLPLWFDAGTILALQHLALLSLETLRNAMPYMSTIMGWLVPVIWVVWGFGFLFLLVMAGGAHWLASRYLPARPAAA